MKSKSHYYIELPEQITDINPFINEMFKQIIKNLGNQLIRTYDLTEPEVQEILTNDIWYLTKRDETHYVLHYGLEERDIEWDGIVQNLKRKIQ